NWEWHTFDTVKGGDYLVDQDAAEIMAKEAIDAVSLRRTRLYSLPHRRSTGWHVRRSG
ncbi:FAD-binding protein, partial [Mycobacterium tuberculosis]|nr:FAD-binding protein [Mycobacterium tuberculosis]